MLWDDLFALQGVTGSFPMVMFEIPFITASFKMNGPKLKINCNKSYYSIYKDGSLA